LISVIVPIRGESAAGVENLRHLLVAGESEILVASPPDRFKDACEWEAAGARLIPGRGTRGARLARAAEAASGEVLFFLHADSRPPPEALARIRAAVAGGAAAGAFSLAYAGAGPALALVAAWANLRSRLFRLPFGDQGLFCRRDAYALSGGFRDIPVCDDLDFVRRIRRAGRFVILPEKTVTSPRRFIENGVFRQGLRDWRVQIGYFAGVPPETLERWYNGR
jgi:glycosyltransferase involved in cell wall biosynthesis